MIAEFEIGGTLSLYSVMILLVSSAMLILNVQNANGDYVFESMWGTSGSGDGQFNFPQGVAIDSSEKVFVADTNNHRIQMFQLSNPCPTGTSQIVAGVCFVTKWGTKGLGDGQFDLPFGVAIDSSGNVFVADTNNNRIQKFRISNPCPTGTSQIVAGVCFVTKWGTEGSGGGQFKGPFDVALDSSGNVFVADTFNNRAQKFTNQGVFIKAWGPVGSGNGEFRHPLGIGTDFSGNVFVSDTNHRIQKFDNDGAFIKAWGSEGTGTGQFRFPSGIATDSLGGVFVTDNTIHRIQRFTNDGAFDTTWGTMGSGNGQFKFPRDVAVITPGIVFIQYVYVSDTDNNRIQVFRWQPVINPGAEGFLGNNSVTK